MTQELLEQAIELKRKIEQCEIALKFMTHGTYHRHDKNEYTHLSLPEEVCNEIRDAIGKWKEDYEMQLQEL